MRVTNNGYRDPNNLKFENITILGVPYAPTSTRVSSTSRRDGSSTTTSTYTEDYDSEKKVQKPFAIIEKCDVLRLQDTIGNDRREKPCWRVMSVGMSVVFESLSAVVSCLRVWSCWTGWSRCR